MNQLLPWHWRSLPLESRTGSEVFNLLFRKNYQIATLLESPFPGSAEQPQLTGYSICAGAPRLQDRQLQLWTPAVGKILPFLRSLLQRNHSNITQPSHLPFTGGWLGWLGYDLAIEIEQLPSFNCDPLPFPVAYWYEPASFAVLDHTQQILWLATTEPVELDQLQDQLESGWREGELLSGGAGVQGSRGDSDERFQTNDFRTDVACNVSTLTNECTEAIDRVSRLRYTTTQADYENAVRQAKKYIQAGDIFQANLSLRFEATTTAESWAIYRALRYINPSPFASYWQTPWGVVISCSPERLIQLRGKQAQTRPIAGTRSRGKSPVIDQQLAQELLAHSKERAEHIMLVDLERNDLGRVCQWGSVKVDELLTIERYSHVMHLVSNVCGILRTDCDAVDLIRALFPGGTITGCPKVRCMEIIEELEPVRRNLFYGSCGYLDQRGNLDLNILIRTLLMRSDRSHSVVWGQVGAGIVADSDPEQEWHESLHKAAAQLAALQLAAQS